MSVDMIQMFLLAKRMHIYYELHIKKVSVNGIMVVQYVER